MVQAPGMTLRQLRYFCRVVESGSITEAASTLNVVQTAVGMQVRCLEDLLAAQLLERKARGVVPTKIGRIVYERARRIVEQADSLSTEIPNLGAARQRAATIGMVPSLIRAIGARAATAETSTSSKSTLCLVEGSRHDLLRKLKSGEIDYAYVHDVDEEEGLWSVPVLRQSLVFLTGSNEKPASGPLTLSEAVQRPLVLRTGPSWSQDLVLKAAASLGCVPNVVCEIDSESAMLEIVSSGVASAIVVGDAFAEYISLGTVIAHPIVQPKTELTLSLAAVATKTPGATDRRMLRHLDSLIDEFCAFHGCTDRRMSQAEPGPTTLGGETSRLRR